MNRKNLSAEFIASASGFQATITTATLDRDGEVVIAQGMDATEYERNPVLFWNHDYTLPVGKCSLLTRTPTSIVGNFEFAERPSDYTGDFFPDFVRAVVGQGVVRGVSIGYNAVDGGTRRATPEDRKRYGDGVHTVFSKWKLIEVSVAPLQCNPDALISAVRKGAVNPEHAKRWLGYAEPRRHSVVVPVPAMAWATRAAERTHAAEPNNAKAIAAREIARARGRLR